MIDRRRYFRCFLFWFCLIPVTSRAQSGEQLRLVLHAEPKTFDPLLVADEPSETIRYLTAGVLIRVDRQTQKFVPELAVSWKVSEGGRKISFELRQNVLASDGTPFSADDVVYTMKALMDPQLHSPTGDSFRSSEGRVEVTREGPYRVSILFPAPIAGVERLFDQAAIVPSHSPQKESATLGPFYVADHKAGTSILLKRNPNYWKRDSHGKQLPYLDSVQLEILQNRDTELLRFRRGEIHLINRLDAEYFDHLAADGSSGAKDLGPAFDTEQMWFNEVAAAPLPANHKSWFRSANFRKAVSEAINREDLCRVVFNGHASPAAGPVSPANQFWLNKNLKQPAYDPPSALRRLQADGFRFDGKTLFDPAGQRVEFSIITNAGNKARERMAAMIQQDLTKIGIQVNIVTLDFPSLIERITRTFDYDACLLGLVNVDLDPDGQMNVWLSSSANHQWNPEEKSPETSWEAEIDKLMRMQSSSIEAKSRKEAFDRVQQIVSEQAPFIYLVHKNALVAVSPALRNVAPTPLNPQTFWNVEYLYFEDSRSARNQ
jgi:peptide/nickel transport system substrate-binding protein